MNKKLDIYLKGQQVIKELNKKIGLFQSYMEDDELVINYRDDTMNLALKDIPDLIKLLQWYIEDEK